MVSVLMLGGITAVFVLLSFIQFPSIFIWIAAGYFAFRVVKLASTGFGCTTCWLKTVMVGIILLSLLFVPSIQILVGCCLLLLLLGSTFLTKGTKQTHKHH